MNNQYTIFAGIINDSAGAPIGLSFPIDVGHKPITGPESWQLYLKEQELLRQAVDLLIAYARGEKTYEKIRHLVEAKELPEPECSCFLPEQSCSVCSDHVIIGDLKMVSEETTYR